jgi:hypothetical protein
MHEACFSSDVSHIAQSCVTRHSGNERHELPEWRVTQDSSDVTHSSIVCDTSLYQAHFLECRVTPCTIMCDKQNYGELGWLWLNFCGFDRIRVDLAGLGWIWWIWEDSAGFWWLRLDSGGLGMDLGGFGWIWVDRSD